MNDKERELWVMNDEGLYSWWQSTSKGITTFVRENRAELTRVIESNLNKEPSK